MSEVTMDRSPEEIKAAALPKASRRQPENKTDRCKVYLLAEEEGGFSIRAASLPGVASQGETEQEALDNVVEALEGVLASYQAHGEKIPWSKSERPMERGEVERWVTIHG